MTYSDRAIARYDALCALLSRPDGPDLLNLHGKPRGKRYVQAGDAAKRDGLKRDFACAYIRHRMADAGEDCTIVSVRRRALLKLIRRRA